MDGKQALETLKKQYKRQNEYNKTKYDRINVMFPSGTKNRIQETGQSMNSFIIAAVLQALEEHEAAAAVTGPADQEQETNVSMAAYMVPPETKEEQPETIRKTVSRVRQLAEQAKRNNQELRKEEN